MELIDKDALVVEIERKIETHKETLKNCDSNIAEMVLKSSMSAYQSLLHFIDTLELKEVDFEKIWKEYFKYRGDVATVNVKHLAKHFYELGLKVNNPTTAADRGIAEEIIVNLKRIEQDYCIDLTKEMQWLRDIVKKGE